MKLKNAKSITAMALSLTIVGTPIGQSIYAAENTESLNNQVMLMQAQDALENLEVTEDLINYVKIIDSSTSFIDGNYHLDENKAISLGLSESQVQSAQASYKEINNSINNGTVRVSEDGSNVITSNRSKRAVDKVIFSKSISAKKCNDIAALLAIVAGAAAVAAGIANIIPGINALVVPILTVVGGLLTIGSGAFWYAGNHNGVNLRIYKSGKVRI